MLAGAPEDGLAQRDGPEVVPARDVGLGPRFERAEQAGHGAGEGVGEPGLGPAWAVPGPPVVDRRVVERAGDALRPAGPADVAERQAAGPFEPPADADLGPRPLARRAAPDVVPGRGAGLLIFEDVQVDAVGVRERRPGVG